ncbi:homoserine kinase [Basidiobolus meristosporus CBS 931.73]|uniref:Homoserine kinase n=1 Tax=Basidiobolus meristosporus CBS 931.73 TaxID=1314790 RepID=A0A1Y1Y848_9FUNG|nr:homoserine kinase [Basidiobolus meristosporus CBS 931.73]|eukprot:ORX94191.1 homoserine kinase [Basidiobolus meristosporus CBS 931.73]
MTRTSYAKITVPATSANIGPGFDVLGLALSLYLTVEVTVYPPGLDNEASVKLTYEGDGAETMCLIPEKNLITKTALYVLSCFGLDLPKPIAIHINNPIPLGRGLGSSGSAVVAGVALANFVGNLNLSKERMLDYILQIESHPDNVVAALMGGFVAGYLRNPPQTNDTQPPVGVGSYARLGWAKEIKAIAIIPQFELATEKARKALPVNYQKEDVIFNLQRLTILANALSHSPPNVEKIYEAMQDKIHQPYRKHLIPGLPEIIETMTPSSHPGLVGICLSGAGPTVLALATDNFEKIARDAQEIFARQSPNSIRTVVKLLDVVEEGYKCQIGFAQEKL